MDDIVVTNMFEQEYTTVKKIVVDGIETVGITTKLPGVDNEILQLRCKNGIMLCGIFSASVLDILKVSGCIFSAPKFDDMLEKAPKAISKKAVEMGVTGNMTGREIIKLFS